MLLFALIAIAWLAVTVLCVAVCMMARRGDAGDGAELSLNASRLRADRRRSATGDGLVVWDGLPGLSVQVRDARLTAHSAR
ncbi:MAG: hypothetical protein ACLQQB_00760 [Solirubrobacteraceae bacterium]|jgi:hypothetical protein